MEDNEKVEETTEKNDEELEELDESSNEPADEANETDESLDEELEDLDETSEESDVPTLEDYESLQKKVKTLEAQKKHWKKKATSKPKAPLKESKEEINKPNEKDIDFEESMDIRFLKRDGYSDEDINKLKVIKYGYASEGKEISLLDAVNDDLFKAVLEHKKLEDKKNKAQLSSSGKPLTHSDKKMTPEEFEKFRQGKSKEYLKSMGFTS